MEDVSGAYRLVFDTLRPLLCIDEVSVQLLGGCCANPATAKARLIAVTAYGRDEDRGCLDNELAAPVWPLKVNEANERLAQHQGSHRDQLITFRRQPGRDATIWRAEPASRLRASSARSGAAAGRGPA
jgi:hypothetical protein